MSLNSKRTLTILIAAVFIVFGHPTVAGIPHVINFRWPNLYPESLTWDPLDQHFIVGSLRDRTLVSVSDAGVAETLVHDPSLPSNIAIIGVYVDRYTNRLLAVVHHPQNFTNFLASYDLLSRPRSRLFLAPLVDNSATGSIANDVTVDYKGNAYVTNSGGNFIWKVTIDGESSIFSKSPIFTSHPVDLDVPACGLNGVVYNSKDYLLVVQSNTGKLYKVNVDDGTARTVMLNKKLTAADGMAIRGDGVLVVVSQHKAYFIKSDDSWSRGAVFDETALDAERFATSVAMGEKGRAYVLYGHVNEGIMGKANREEFSIVEVRSKDENEDEAVWVFILIGLGLAYFLFWRFQMGQLVRNMNKKTD